MAPCAGPSIAARLFCSPALPPLASSLHVGAVDCARRMTRPPPPPPVVPRSAASIVEPAPPFARRTPVHEVTSSTTRPPAATSAGVAGDRRRRLAVGGDGAAAFERRRTNEDDATAVAAVDARSSDQSPVTSRPAPDRSVAPLVLRSLPSEIVKRRARATFDPNTRPSVQLGRQENGLTPGSHEAGVAPSRDGARSPQKPSKQ